MSFPNADDLELWLVSRLADVRGMDARAIDPQERFHRYGLDSLGAMRLIAELSQRLGRALAPTLVWEYPTPRALAKHLTDDVGSASPRSSIPPPSAATTNPSEPVAIVGMACRFPKAASIEAFWQLLRDGTDAVTEVPRDRWDAAALYDPNGATPGKLNTRWGGFLDRVDQFDPQFFGISPREAVQMDPQQRLILELAWEALEDAGIPPPSLKESRTGVFVGALFMDHALLQDRAGWDLITSHTSTGGAACIIANRVSYVLGLQGPSMTVDTASSSSLVAIHLACQSLRLGESNLVLAGGVNLTLVPETTMRIGKLNAMSSTGRCRAFDAQGDGYVRGEGAGIIALKKLSDALKDGDRIYAVIRGSAVNNDGASNGLTAPNPKAQEAVLVDAYHAAGILPHEVHYVEAHGTGTPLGDPIEAKALGAVLAGDLRIEQKLHIGSVKTNIGHLEAAAGVAGLIKVALAMHHEMIPPNLNFDTPNPNIDFESLRLQVVTRAEPWPVPEGELYRAGVSSFGYGGTNAHAVLESMPKPTSCVALVEGDSDASQQTALEEAVDKIRDQRLPNDRVLRVPPKGTGQRIAVIANTPGGLAQRLEEVRIGADGRGIFRGQTTERRRLAWVFSGQGSHWSGMGRMLVHAEPVFRSAMIQCDRELQAQLGWSVLDEVSAGCPRVSFDRIDVMWPVLFSFQVSLAHFLRHLGVEPAVVVGHSIGEVSAAHVAGALSLPDAARILARQARLVQKAVGKGVMLLAAIPWAEALTISANSGGRIHCAIAASPKSTVFSGESGALAALATTLTARGVFTRSIPTSVAVHGPQMDYLRQELPRQLIDLRPMSEQVPIVSGVSGERIRGENLDIMYWSRQLREPVRFASAIQGLLDSGVGVFLEIAPHPIVKQSIEECIAHTERKQTAVALATMWRNEDEGRAIREAVGTLFVHGIEVTTRQDTDRQKQEDGFYLLPISGQVDLALRDTARNLAAFMQRHGNIALQDICYVSSVRRAHHRTRAIITGRTQAELIEGLHMVAEHKEGSSIRAGVAPLGNPPGLVFVFSGQGSQWIGMGRQLYREEPAFRRALAACDAAIQKEAGFSIVDELNKPEDISRIHETIVTQPALFAIEVALAALLQSWGVVPSAVIGHSVGEIAAAHVAGMLDLPRAARLVTLRAKVMQKATGYGKMISIPLPEREVLEIISGHEERIGIAAVNDLGSVILSGDIDLVDEIAAQLSANDIETRALRVNYAFHSPQMEPLAAEFLHALGHIDAKPGTIPMLSTVTARFVNADQLDAAYWARNIRQTVRFAETVLFAFSNGLQLFVEVGPHPVLTISMEETLVAKGTDFQVIPTLRREKDERVHAMLALAALYVRGHGIDWKQVFPQEGSVVSLPNYPWQRDRFWLQDDVRSRLSSGRHHASTPTANPDDHPLLGTSLLLAVEPAVHVWENTLHTNSIPYLGDYRIQGEAIFPNAGYVEMALAGATELLGSVPAVLEEVVFERLFALSREVDRRMQVVVADEGPDRKVFRMCSREMNGTTWVQHASGKVRTGLGLSSARIARDRPRVVQARCTTTMMSSDFYAQMEKGGRVYGKGFRGIESFWLGNYEGLARCYLHPEHFVAIDKYEVHPALLDACFQTLIGVQLASLTTIHGTFVVAGLERLRIYRPLGVDIWIHAEKHPTDDPTSTLGDVFVIDAEGRVLAEMAGVRVKQVESGKATSTSSLDDAVYAIEWRKKDLDTDSMRAKPPTGPSAWLFFIDEGGTAAAMSFLLIARGEACVRVRRGTRFARVEAGLYEIEAANPEHYQRLLREAFGREVACKGIVHLFALDSASWDATTADTLMQDVERGCLSVMYLVQAMSRQGWRDTPRLWIATRGAQAVLASGVPLCVSQSTLWGLGRTIALEHPEVECTRIDMDPVRSADEASLLWREILARCREDQVAYRKEGRFVARLVKSSFEAGDMAETNPPSEPAKDRSFHLECLELGALDRLALREFPRRAPGLGEVEIRVEAASLNFPDVMAAMGMLPGTTAEALKFGLECAGRIVAVGNGVEHLTVGQEVIAFATGSIASHVTTMAEFVVPKPAKLSFVEAASIPVVFMTVYYALNKLVRLGHDERILIHTAAGGTGLAAIQMARVLQAEIFATAGTDEKRAYLHSIGIDHVMDSRSLSFADEVMDKTDGQGVDVVLNTLTGDARARSLELLAPYGRFVELSKRDIYLNTQMPPLRRSVSFASADLPGMAQERPALLGTLLREVMQLVDMGVFQPLPLRVFPANETRNAFKLMEQAQHIGKIVIDMSDPMTQILPANRPRGGIRPDVSYLITGGLGGLGLTLAQWMVEQGARHVTLVSRHEPSPVAQEAIVRMETMGAQVLVSQADISSASQTRAVFAEMARAMPPLGGVVHAAGLLDDRTLLEMDAGRFLHVLEPKVLGAFHLHSLTIDKPLDFFVLYSSVSSLLGAPGQANYAAANAFLDGLAHARRRAGLAGTSIHWGPFADIGLMASHEEQGQRMSHRGIESLTPAQGPLAFARLLERPRAEVAILRLSLHQWFDFYPHMAGNPYWSELQRDHVAERTPSSRVTFRQILERKPLTERLPMLEQHVLEHVGHVFRLDASHIDRLSSFKSLGMDSFLSLELRNRLEYSLGVRLSATLLFTYPNPASLADHLLDKMNLGTTKHRTSDTGKVQAVGSTKQGERLAAASTDALKPAPVAIRQMSVAEAELLLEEELARSEDYLQ